MVGIPGIEVPIDLEDRRFQRAIKDVERSLDKAGEKLSDFDDVIVDTGRDSQKTGSALEGLSGSLLAVAAGFFKLLKRVRYV